MLFSESKNLIPVSIAMEFIANCEVVSMQNLAASAVQYSLCEMFLETGCICDSIDILSKVPVSTCMPLSC